MKKIIALLLVVTLVFSLAACGDKPSDTKDPTTTPSDKPVEIEFATWWSTEIGEDYYNDLIAEFEKANPNITVKLSALPFGDVRSVSLTNHLSGTMADVVSMNPPWTREFYDLGMLEPLDSYMDGDSSYDKADYVQASYTQIEGNTYLAPVDTMAFFLYYNKTMFEEAGIEAPTTWDEMRAAAKALTDKSKNQYGFTMVMSEAASNSSILQLYPLLYAAGGRTVVDGKFVADTEEMAAAMQLVLDMQNDGSILPGTTSNTEPMISEQFATGNVAMMIQSTAHVVTVSNRNPDLDFGVIAIPSMDGSQADLRHHGWDLAIASGSENKDAAWKFISFMTNASNLQALAEKGMKIPAVVEFDKSYLAPQMADAAEIIANSNAVEELMTMPSTGTCWTELTNAFVAVLTGTKTIDKALDDCQAAWDNTLGQ